MYTNDTLIIIDIQAPNNTEILTCVRETFEFMPGWQFESSVINSPTDARFYAFDLTNHAFEWWRTNETFSDTMDEDEVAIKDLADISHLLEFVWTNGEELRKNYMPASPQKKKRKKTEDEEVEDLSAAFGKFFNTPKTPFEKKTPEKEFNAMDFIKQIQPMNLPKASVFYLDTVYGMSEAEDKDISPSLFDDFSAKIQSCKTVSGLQSIHKGLLGLHGPRAGKLRNMIVDAIQKIQAANPPPYEQKKSWGYEAELHEAMAKKYEEYLYSMQKTKVQSWYDDVHTYHQYKPYPSHYEGKVVKAYMPYSWKDVHSKEMDY